MDLKKTGKYITEKRKDKGLSQKELADILGVTDKAVSRWETGRGFPDVSMLEELANSLEVSVVELIRGEDAGELITENNVRQAVGEIAKLAASRTRKQLGAILSCLLMLAMMGAVIFLIVDRTRDIYDDINMEIPVMIYTEDGTVIGEDMAIIDGEITKDDLSERFDRVYSGEFSFESVFETQLKEVLIEFDYPEPGRHRITYYRHGKAFINEDAVITKIYMSRNMQEFAVRFKDGTVAATSEKMAALMTLEYSYNLHM